MGNSIACLFRGFKGDAMIHKRARARRMFFVVDMLHSYLLLFFFSRDDFYRYISSAILGIFISSELETSLHYFTRNEKNSRELREQNEITDTLFIIFHESLSLSDKSGVAAVSRCARGYFYFHPDYILFYSNSSPFSAFKIERDRERDLHSAAIYEEYTKLHLYS